MAARGDPALPWGHGAERPASQTAGDGFESSLRKIMLSAALGRLVNENPAKRARTSEPDAQVETHITARQAVANFVDVADVLTDPDEAVPSNLAAGQRVQVKWQLEGDDGSEAVWWGAELLAQQRPSSWTLRYDAREAFEREDKAAMLLTNHVLAHEDMDEPLAWRMEGDTYEPDNEEEDSDGNDAEEEEAENSRSYPVTAISEAIEAQMGCSVESAALQRLQASLPIEQQQTLAASFNDFITSITGKLRRVADERRDNSEEGPVIEADDVKAALAAWESESGKAI